MKVVHKAFVDSSWKKKLLLLPFAQFFTEMTKHVINSCAVRLTDKVQCIGREARSCLWSRRDTRTRNQLCKYEREKEREREWSEKHLSVGWMDENN